jgi:hypothetical protein
MINLKSRSPQEWLAAGTGALSAIGGLFKAINDVIDRTKKITPHAGLRPAFFLSVALVIFGIWLLVWAVTKRSRLLRPNSLILRQSEQEDLFGRDETVARLVTKCQRVNEIHLLGESGVGKTALLLSGLIPYLNDKSTFHPFYNAVWIKGFDLNPAYIKDKLLGEMSHSDRIKLNFSDGEPNNLSALVARIKEKLARKLLFIFDEFNVYTTLSKSHLYDPQHDRWLSPDNLININTFWRDIRELVLTEHATVLFSTLVTEAESLRPFTFANAETYYLERLNGGYVEAVLQQVVKSGAIEAPEYGFTDLADKMAKDSYANPILPMHLNFALQGLARLRPLTASAFARAGGLTGLVVLFVQGCIESAAIASGLSEATIRALLFEFIDPATAGMTPKTRMLTVAQLVHEISLHYSLQAQELEGILHALNTLKQNDILRASEPHPTEQSQWFFYYDQFCFCTLEAIKNANRFIYLLQSRYGLFASRTGLWQFWNRLLPIRVQLLLWYYRLRGRFRFAQFRGYAAVSILRFTPILLLGLLYFGAADYGLQVPGARRTRTFIDRLHVSIFRPLPSVYEVLVKGRQLRSALINEILRRRTARGWILPGPVQTNIDTWAHPQALCALYSAPESRTNSAFPFLDSLKVLYESRITVMKSTPKPYGWLNGVDPSYTIAEPSLWTIDALAASAPDKGLLKDGDLKLWSNLWQYAQSVIPTYRTDPSGGWNVFPDQKDPHYHSVYTTVLALQALLDSQNKKLPWLHSEEYNLAFIRQSTRWLISQYEWSATPPGWRAHAAVSAANHSCSEGLTLQVYATLLEAELEVGIKMPDPMKSQIPNLLRYIARHPLVTTDHDLFYFEFTNHMGVLAPRRMLVNFLWYPWAIRCATNYLRLTERFGGPADDVMDAERVLGDLLLKRGDEALAEAQSEWTFHASEMLYALSTLDSAKLLW